MICGNIKRIQFENPLLRKSQVSTYSIIYSSCVSIFQQTYAYLQSRPRFNRPCNCICSTLHYCIQYNNFISPQSVLYYDIYLIIILFHILEKKAHIRYLCAENEFVKWGWYSMLRLTLGPPQQLVDNYNVRDRDNYY